eukprot:m.307632 g.307632  ORF g.307632 m.307632 type:complete len:50 (+) comp16463_c1_seq11:2301-2450(+)
MKDAKNIKTAVDRTKVNILALAFNVRVYLTNGYIYRQRSDNNNFNNASI